MSAQCSTARIKAVFFDLMGTCLDWHTGITQTFPQHIPEWQRSELAIQWRQAFFDEIANRFEAKLPQEDIDETHRRTLEVLLQKEGREARFGAGDKIKAIQAWHRMTAWAEVPRVLHKLRTGYEVFVLANGTTRFQLDLMHSSGLQFDMLFSSELLGFIKPAPEMYRTAMKLVKVKPDECVMVAAHAYDLRAAKAVGMKTVYVRRWTEDVCENMNQVERENNFFLDDMNDLYNVIENL